VRPLHQWRTWAFQDSLGTCLCLTASWRRRFLGSIPLRRLSSACGARADVHPEGSLVTSPAGHALVFGRRVVLFGGRPAATSGTLGAVSSLRPLLSFLVLVGVSAVAAAQSAPPAGAGAKAEGLPPEKLEALVSPIASFPDRLLGQVLAAACLPDQVVAAANWVKANPKVTGKDLEAALQGQSWDASVKALCSFPEVLVKMMSEHMDWTRDLGLAYRNQKDAVLFAVQQLRARALAAGNLKSTKEQTVQVDAIPEAEATEGTATTIIRIEPTNPQVIYVPVYSPTVVYGTWVYPAYPPPPVYPPGYVAGAAMVSFSIGFAIGSSAWRYPPYPVYPRYPAYPPPRPPAGARPPASGARPPSGGTAPPPSASTRPGTPSQQPAGGGGRNPSAGSPPSASTRPAGPQGAGVSNQLPSGGAGGGRAPSQLPSGGAGGGRSPSQSPAGGTGDRGWGGGGGGGGGGGARPSQGGSAFQGMNNGGQARAQSTRGNASYSGARSGGGSRGGGGGRRR
jgi:uncharacterized membrane protein YgcG